MIKVVSFDIGGTLINFNSSNTYGFDKLSILLNLPYELVRKTYKNVFQKQKGSLEELVNKFCDELNININSDVTNFFKEKFNEKNNINYINDEIFLLIQKLKQEGYKIILTSNSCCLIENKISDDILKYIDGIFYSYDYGYTKEDEQFYRIIEKKLNFKSNEFLHIGDNLTNDYIMPKKYGWNAIYYVENKNIKINIDNFNK